MKRPLNKSEEPDPLLRLDIYAEIIIFSYDKTTEQGRKLPIKSGYCPNHCVEKIDEKNIMIMGGIYLLNQEILSFDTLEIVKVKFLTIDKYIQKIQVGFEWEIFEAWRKVGEGRVLEILPNIETQWIG